MIVPVGEEPPLSVAVSWIAPPSATPGDAVVESVGVGAGRRGGGGPGGGRGRYGQFAIVRCFENEPWWPSRVSFDVQDDVTTTLPLPAGIGSVCEKESREGRPCRSCVVAAPPPAGVNTIFQLGVFVSAGAGRGELRPLDGDRLQVALARRVRLSAGREDRERED